MTDFKISTGLYDDLIVNEIADNIMGTTFRTIFSIRDQQIKDALVGLGWTPPITNSGAQDQEEKNAPRPKLPDKKDEFLYDIFHERCRAKKLHPTWPVNVDRQVAIMAGKAGEALRASLHYVEGRGSIAEVREELIQTGAMVLRCLEHLEGVE